MIILVVVTIRISETGGLFSKAREAKEKTQIEKEKEEISTIYWGSELFKKAVTRDWGEDGIWPEEKDDGTLVYPEGAEEIWNNLIGELKDHGYYFKLDKDHLAIIDELISIIVDSQDRSYVITIETGVVKQLSIDETAADYYVVRDDGRMTIEGYNASVTLVNLEKVNNNQPNTSYDEKYKTADEKIREQMQIGIMDSSTNQLEPCTYTEAAESLLENGTLGLTGGEFYYGYFKYFGEEVKVWDFDGGKYKTYYEVEGAIYDKTDSEGNRVYSQYDEENVAPLSLEQVLSILKNVTDLEEDINFKVNNLIIPDKDKYGNSIVALGCDYEDTPVFRHLWFNTIEIPKSIKKIGNDVFAGYKEYINQIIFKGRTSLDDIELASNWAGGFPYTTEVVDGNLVLTFTED